MKKSLSVIAVVVNFLLLTILAFLVRMCFMEQDPDLFLWGGGQKILSPLAVFLAVLIIVLIIVDRRIPRRWIRIVNLLFLITTLAFAIYIFLNRNTALNIGTEQLPPEPFQIVSGISLCVLILYYSICILVAEIRTR